MFVNVVLLSVILDTYGKLVTNKTVHRDWEKLAIALHNRRAWIGAYGDDDGGTASDAAYLFGPVRGGGFDLSYDYDQVGNWLSYDRNSIVQTRQHNAANEITAIDDADGDIAYDAAGNVIKKPIISGNEVAGHLTLIYDAWNRLIQVDHENGFTLQTLAYDGAHRRICSTVTPTHAFDGQWHSYYLPNSQSQIEIRNGSDQVISQYIWANLAGQYIDDLCQITHNGDPAQDANFEASDPDHDPRVFYTCQDIQSNVIGLILGNSQSQFAGHLPGDLIERYTYDPYGSRDVYKPEDVGDTLCTILKHYTYRLQDPSGVYTTVSICPVGFQGLFLDEETGLYNNRVNGASPWIIQRPGVVKRQNDNLQPNHDWSLASPDVFDTAISLIQQVADGLLQMHKVKPPGPPLGGIASGKTFGMDVRAIRAIEIDVIAWEYDAPSGHWEWQGNEGHERYHVFVKRTEAVFLGSGSHNRITFFADRTDFDDFAERAKEMGLEIAKSTSPQMTDGSLPGDSRLPGSGCNPY